MFGWLRKKIRSMGKALSFDDYFKDLGSTSMSTSGIYISPETAQKTSAVYACTELIANSISSLPILAYKGTPGMPKLPMPKHYLLKLLYNPCDSMTAKTFWSSMVRNKLLGGRAVAVIEWYGNGLPKALRPIHYRNVVTYKAYELGMDTKLGVGAEELFFLVTMDGGRTQKLLPDSEVLHIPNVSLDGGRTSLSAISAGADAVGLAIASERHSGLFFSQGAAGNVALKFPNKIGPDTIKVIKEEWAKNQGGLANHWLPKVITEGGDLVRISMTAEDAQLIESRQFQVIDICRFFGVPPVMIGETEKTSSWGSGVEQMARWFAQFTINPHLTDFEQELKRKLIVPFDESVKFDESELTRGDTKSMTELLNMARGSLTQPQLLTRNECRSMIGFPPEQGYDQLEEMAKQEGQSAQTPA